MLDLRTENLQAEIEASIKFRDSKLDGFQRDIERYVGPESNGSGEYDPENYIYQYLAVMVPRLVFNNPRVRTSTRRTDEQARVEALAIQTGLNRWIKDVNLVQPLQELAVQMLMRWGVAMVSVEPTSGPLQTIPSERPEGEDEEASLQETDDVPHMPAVDVLDPRRVGADPRAMTLRECRYVFHEWSKDKDDLAEQAENAPEGAGWNVAAIRDLQTGEDPNSKLKRPQVPDRKQVHGVELWTPETMEGDDLPGPDEGFHGQIITLAWGRNGMVEIRRRPFFGPRTGPYHFFGVYYVPGCVWPLSPTVANAGQAEWVNRIAKANLRAMERRKKLFLFNKRRHRDAQALKDAVDGDFVGMDSLESGGFTETEVGGASNAANDELEMERARLDRSLGLSDATRGVVTGDATATENALADEAAKSRFGFIEQRFTEAANRLIKHAAHLLWHDSRIVIQLSDQDRMELERKGVPPPNAVQGGRDEESKARFEDLEVEIELYSMRRTDEAAQAARLGQTYQIVTQSIPLVGQFPSFPWSEMFSAMGDATNTPELGRMFRPEVVSGLQEDMAAMAEMGAQGASQGGGGPEVVPMMDRRKPVAGVNQGGRPKEKLTTPPRKAQSGAGVPVPQS